MDTLTAQTVTASKDDDPRYAREAAFHDKTFSEDSRARISRYYAITDSSKNFYRDFLVEHSAGKRVLEYGCGPYSYSSLMLPRGATVVGIDISSVAMQQYRDRVREQGFGEARPCVMNAEILAFGSQTFDLVCGVGILHHLNVDRCLQSISRILKPGGQVIFLEPLGHNPLINLFRRMTPAARTPDEHPLVMQDIATAGRYFADVETNYFHFQSLLAVPSRKLSVFPKIVSLLDRGDQALFRSVPFLGRYAWAVALVLRAPRLSC